MSWFGYFIIILALSLAMELVLIRYVSRFFETRRLGGVAIVLIFLMGILFNPEIVITPQIGAILSGMVAILIFGLVDDFQDLSWKKQLIFQIGLGLWLVIWGYQINYISSPVGGVWRFDFLTWQLAGIQLSIISTVLVIGWVLLLINSLNWVDGMDGLAGGISLLASIAIFLVSLYPEVRQPALAIVALIFAGALLGFWWFNIPPARIEAGSSGSYCMGFVMAALAIMAGTKIATALIVLAIPVADALWVLVERKRDGQGLTKKDQLSRHLHYKLRKIGWSDLKILLTYLIFLSVSLFLSLYFDQRFYKIVLLVGEWLLVFLFIGWVSRKLTKPKF